MIFCEKCFKDEEIKAVIKGINHRGNCSICHSQKISVYDTDINTELSDLFTDFLSIFTPKNDLPKDFPNELLTILKEELYNNWSIFNVDKEKIYLLITEICKEKFNEQPELFNEAIGILQMNDKEYLEKNCILKTFEWIDFVESIKHENRFHTDHINREVLKLFFSLSKENYKSSNILYRARISNGTEAWQKKQMGAPPREKASGGRVNPAGLSFLYLAEDKETAIFEIRAGIYEFLTIGEFKFKKGIKDIELINFTKLDKLSPFLLSYSNAKLEFIKYAINIKHLKKISEEIAKPMRRQDGEFDYLPTQYICDFVKSCGYDGVKYESTMNENKYNLAVFDEALLKCNKVKSYRISSLNYKFSELSKE